jgi:acyl-CoA thioester hydrolase
MTDQPALDRRDTFRAWVREHCRYGDTDRQGHVNNAVFATFCESGRVDFLYDPAHPAAPSGHAFVIARLVLEFRAELLYRDIVEIGTTVLRIGRTSFTLGQGLFRGDTCVATAEAVIVLMDEATRRAAPLPGALRARLAGVASGPGGA